MHRSWVYWFATLALILGVPEAGVSADIDEFKVKRQEVFEFTEKPKVARDTTSQPDRFVITFAGKGYCDATVAIEDASGRIVRHLASGVLGKNAPPPFQKDSLRQTIVWDGKDDAGRYIDNLAGFTVRVSLGLKPQFERTLFWSPHKRIAPPPSGYPGTTSNRPTPIVAAGPDGVLVFEGSGVDHLRLFDHAGNYLRTVYPFASNTLDKVQGLTWKERPQDGARLPLTTGFLMSTLLTSGATARSGPYNSVLFGAGALAIAVQPSSAPDQPGRIALAHYRLNRLATDGSSGQGGPRLTGPATTVRVHIVGGNIGVGGQKDLDVGPTSIAFSPDGKWLYLGGFTWRDGVPGQSLHRGNLPGVARLAFAEDKPMELFAGSLNAEDTGAEDNRFRGATGIACDSHGRVYAADYMNDRVQVFSPEGRFLKSIPAVKPARIAVHARSGELYVFSWGVHNESIKGLVLDEDVPPTLTRLGPFDDPKKLATYPLPIANKGLTIPWYRGTEWDGFLVEAALDSWTDPPTVWLISVVSGGWDGVHPDRFSDQYDNKNVRLLAVTEEAGRPMLKVVRDFGRDVKQAVVRSSPPGHQRQRLNVNPRTGKLYICEGHTGYYDAFYEVVEVDPQTGKQRLVQLPFDAEDMTFDPNGLAYLRTNALVARYDPAGDWREVPFDYGEERQSVGWDRSAGKGRRAEVGGGIAIPVPPYVCEWHLGGIAVNARGHVLVPCLTHKQQPQEIALRTDTKLVGVKSNAGYCPRLYPGRPRQSEYHVYDEHGKMLVEDAVPGLALTEGVGLDREGNIYALATDPRVLPDGKPYFVGKSGTLMKFKPRAARFRMVRGAFVPVPMPPEEKPKRLPDLRGEQFGPIWVDGAEWFYGGVGWWGWNAVDEGGGCSCWNARFVLDQFARSFAPELDHYSVAVLDSAGNLILRIGKYGNVDDGKPLVADGGPAMTRAIGGDEVALFRPAYVGTDTDRRLFIADAGNARLLSVKLDYHRTETVPLGDRGPKLPTP